MSKMVVSRSCSSLIFSSFYVIKSKKVQRFSNTQCRNVSKLLGKIRSPLTYPHYLHTISTQHIEVTLMMENGFPYYLTIIRLRARDFYEVIVDEGEAQINHHFIEIESE